MVRFHSTALIWLFWAIANLAVAGCSYLQANPARKQLPPPRMSSDSVALDLVFVQVPDGSESLSAIWKDLDEQIIPASQREQFYRHGFRVGRVTGAIPTKLVELMKLTDQAPASPELTVSRPVDGSEEAFPIRRHLQLRTGHRTEILASEIYDELPFLRSEEGRLVGRTLHKAQGVFGLWVDPSSAGATRLRLIPELQHGEARVQPVVSHGTMRWELQRDKVILDDLTIEAELQPGDLIVLTCWSNRPGSLGNRFFTTISQGKREQKILIIRLSQTQATDLFQSAPAT